MSQNWPMTVVYSMLGELKLLNLLYAHAPSGLLRYTLNRKVVPFCGNSMLDAPFRIFLRAPLVEENVRAKILNPRRTVFLVGYAAVIQKHFKVAATSHQRVNMQYSVKSNKVKPLVKLC